VKVPPMSMARRAVGRVMGGWCSGTAGYGNKTLSPI
jgi:hypothetical protein